MADGWENFFQPGETLIWDGPPLTAIQGWCRIIGMALFGLLFLVIGTGIPVTGLAMLIGPTWTDFGLGVFIAAFSIPFAGIGAFLVFGQGITAARGHRRIRCTLSTRCADIGNEKDSDGDRSTTRIGFDNIAEGGKVLSLIRSIQTGRA